MKILAVVGPTAVGKSEVAIELAEALGGEIVNADALQAYRYLDLGTAKPTAEERARVPHHLLDILEPSERYSAGEFARRARVVVAEITARGRLPIVVGGSGFYHRALVQGLAPVPSVPSSVRSALVARLESEGRDSLFRELFTVDPETAQGFGIGDTQRLLRALEVFHGTGVPLSTWWQRRSSDEEPISALSIGLTVPRTILYHRIERRTAAMFAAGWVEEVRSLLSRGYTPDQPAFQAIGYRQIVAHLGGNGPLEAAIEETLTATRQFAKRQLTWFRKEPDVEWFDAQDLKFLKRQVREFLRTNRVWGEVDA